MITITVGGKQNSKYHKLRVYSYNKTVDDFGFQSIARFIKPRYLIITSADDLDVKQIFGLINRGINVKQSN